MSGCAVTERLRDLYFAESKPDELNPGDMALLTYLMLRESEDYFCRDSQETLAARLGCERGAIKRSIDRLEKLGWLSVQRQFDWNEKTRRKTRGIFASSGLSVNMERLPTSADRATRNKPSTDAIDLATAHTSWVIANVPSRYKSLPKRWHKQQEFAAQRLIEKAGSAEVAAALVNFALNNSSHKAAARSSLSAVRRKFRAIWEDYAKEVVKGSLVPTV